MTRLSSLPDAGRILIVRTDRMGDMLSATPAIRAVRGRFPAARIDVLASDENVQVARANPHVERVFFFNRRNPLTWLKTLFQLRRQRYDLLLCLSGKSSKAAFLSRWAGARVSYGLTVPKYARSFDRALTDVPFSHMVWQQLDFLRELGIEPDGGWMEFRIPPEAARQAAEAYPRVEGVPRLAVFIGNAKKIHSRWPAEKFAELVGRLLDVPAGSVPPELWLLHGPAEAPLLSYFSAIEGLKRFSGPLESTAAFLLTCDALVTSSSGPWHLAAALGVPTLSIVSRHSHEYWKPLDGRHRFVLADAKDDPDVRSVAVEPVLAMVENFLEELRAKGAA